MKLEFPGLKNVADTASSAAQRLYLALNMGQLGLLIAAALVSGITLNSERPRHIASWIICVLMTLALLCTISIRVGKFEVRWFKCRAFAENAKSLAWRFVAVESDACVSPEDIFLTEWARLLERLPEVKREFALVSETGELFTNWMREARLLPLPEKVLLYREHRLKDQVAWYAKNATRNAVKQTRWFWALFLVEAATTCIAGLQAWLLLRINLVGVLAAIASGMIAWFQIKKYSDLSTTYAIAAEDLTLIGEKFRIVSDQNTMNVFVEDVEGAISREHSMWLARRSC